jgi:RNA polymerase sigma factor (sigma-70 family)
MNDTLLSTAEVMSQNRLSETIDRERPRLLNFIRRRVADAADAEDILQDVFSALVEAALLLPPIEHLGAWLYRVARNRIVDRSRKKQELPFAELAGDGEEGLSVEDLLPSREAGPDAAYARMVLVEELEAAIEDLPEEQRLVFVAHEIEGRTFRELAEETGTSINTLLARKRYAVLHLRRRLSEIYEEFQERTK